MGRSYTNFLSEFCSPVVRRLICCLGIISLVSIFQGCATLNPAASMRIDVEVYKGPLSKPVDIQWGELEGLIFEARSSLEDYKTNLAQLACQEYDNSFGCCNNSRIKLEVWPKGNAGELMRRPEKVLCNSLCDYTNTLLQSLDWVGDRSTFQKNISELKKTIQSYKNEHYPTRVKLLKKVQSQLAAIKNNYQNVDDKLQRCNNRREHEKNLPDEILKLINEKVGKNEAISPAEMEEISTKLTEWIARGSEVAFLRHIARVSAVFKSKSAAIAGSFIPLVTDKNSLRAMQALLAVIASEYGNQLGSRATILISQVAEKKTSRENLPLSAYLGDSGSTDASNLYDWYKAKAPTIVEQWKGFLPVSTIGLTSRIRTVERLYNDIYWSKINTVYASGTGDVTMAFIQDDKGNWNLKSFDNDPTELLNAYSEMSKAALKSATKVIKAAATKGGTEALAKVYALTDILTINTPSPTALRSEEQVRSWHRNVLVKLKSLKTSYESADAKCTKNPEKCRGDAESEIRAILHDHGVSLAALQEFALNRQESDSALPAE